MIRFFIRLTLYPGFARSVLGLVLGALAMGFTYRSLALGEKWLATVVLLLVTGLLLGGVKGIIWGAIFNIPAHVLLFWPVPPQTAQFGTILLAFAVFLGAVPTLFVALGFLLRKAAGAAIAALLIVPGYITFLAVFPLPLGAGPVTGALLMFGGFGAALGYLWGIGAISPGAFAHEGPTTYAHEHENLPDLYREGLKTARQKLPELIQTFAPLVRPLLIALGVGVGLVLIISFIALNPIVRVSRVETSNAAASALVVTGDKLLLFIVIVVVILGAVATLAVGLALLIRLINGQVNAAKQAPAEPLQEPPQAFKLANFFVSWVSDVLNGLRRSVQR